MRSKKTKYLDGFTLIELMITIAIIAVLTGVALPSYLSHIDRTRRVDAQSILWFVASQQERFYGNNLRYATPAELGADLANNIQSEDNTYNVTSTYPNGNATFLLTATPLGWVDNDCGVFTLMSNGTKWVGGNPDGRNGDGDADDGAGDVADQNDINACWR
jgi:type IV pilus assembly protein PilE